VLPVAQARPLRFVFLDRDGTLIEDKGYAFRPDDYELLPGVLEGLALLQRAGYRFAIVTNQSGIARRIFTAEEFESFQRLLLGDLEQAGIRVAATYVCPHLPDAGCDCRKPNPAVLFRARDELGIDLAGSWVIGDHLGDVELARRAGCRSILVLTGHGAEEREKLGADSPAVVLPGFLDAARHIVARD
jgi:histidinol-phosphate phosphatase family protein